MAIRIIDTENGCTAIFDEPISVEEFDKLLSKLSENETLNQLFSERTELDTEKIKQGINEKIKSGFYGRLY